VGAHRQPRRHRPRHRRVAASLPRQAADRLRARPGVAALGTAAVIALAGTAITPASATPAPSHAAAAKPTAVRATKATAVPAKPAPERGVASHHTSGVDVSDWQGTAIDWTRVAKSAQFAYVKAAEGTSFVSRTFASQYNGAKRAGLYVGAYAFGRPDEPPVAQADHFVDTANFTRDGKTLPPMLDIEWPYEINGRIVSTYPCYGMSRSAMVAWITAWVDEVHKRTGSPVMIYTAAGWWNECTGGSSVLADQPLFVATYSHRAPQLPKGWTTWTIWQYASQGRLPGDQDVLEGDASTLAALAPSAPATPVTPVTQP
jgi:GH25 family lysozyme M1 (1,4-beta-N-acetylmuramidase)